MAAGPSTEHWVQIPDTWYTYLWIELQKSMANDLLGLFLRLVVHTIQFLMNIYKFNSGLILKD